MTAIAIPESLGRFDFVGGPCCHRQLHFERSIPRAAYITMGMLQSCDTSGRRKGCLFTCSRVDPQGKVYPKRRNIHRSLHPLFALRIASLPAASQAGCTPNPWSNLAAVQSAPFRRCLMTKGLRSNRTTGSAAAATGGKAGLASVASPGKIH